MHSRDIEVSMARQIKSRTGLTLLDWVCFLVPLLISVAVLGWATWEVRLVYPLAFVMFAGLMAVALVLEMAGIWSGRARSSSATSSSLGPNPFAFPLRAYPKTPA